MRALAVVAALLACSLASSACECACGRLNKKAVRQTDVVFRGRIIELKSRGYAIAVFSVDRVWRGNVGSTFELPALASQCCMGFPKQVHVGEEFVVFAHYDQKLDDYMVSPLFYEGC